MLNVGMVLFPRLTQLGLTGSAEVLARLPDTRVRLVAASLEPVRADRGVAIVPDAQTGRRAIAERAAARLREWR